MDNNALIANLKHESKARLISTPKKRLRVYETNKNGRGIDTNAKRYATVKVEDDIRQLQAGGLNRTHRKQRPRFAKEAQERKVIEHTDLSLIKDKIDRRVFTQRQRKSFNQAMREDRAEQWLKEYKRKGGKIILFVQE